jgi:16S rRNA (guanine527-N7)-methyltransferase
MTEEEARQFCAQRVDAAGIQRIEKLAAELDRENTQQNLVSAASLGAIWQRHFADSLQLLDHLPDSDAPILDLGSGAGFPGLALAIALPHRRLYLVESRKRRANWLESVASMLGLSAVNVLSARLEVVASFQAGAITARAFAPLDKLLRLAARFSTPETVWLLPKGRSAAQELAQQSSSVQAMFHVEQSATDAEGGLLIGRGVPQVA